MRIRSSVVAAVYNKVCGLRGGGTRDSCDGTWLGITADLCSVRISSFAGGQVRGLVSLTLFVFTGSARLLEGVNAKSLG